MKYDFDLEDHSKKRKEIFLRVLLCALEIGVVLFLSLIHISEPTRRS